MEEAKGEAAERIRLEREATKKDVAAVRAQEELSKADSASQVRADRADAVAESKAWAADKAVEAADKARAERDVSRQNVAASKADAAADKAKPAKGGRGVVTDPSAKGEETNEGGGGYASAEENSTSVPSGSMTKVQYGKMLIAQAKKKLADEIRQRSAQNDEFQKLQVERFLEMQQRKVEETQQQQTLVVAAVEGFRLKNLEIGKELRTNMDVLAQQSKEEQEVQAARARELVEHAKGVQSPRILESQRLCWQEKKERAREVRQELEEYHAEHEAFGVAEGQAKREVRDRVKSEIGEEALLASMSVVYTERLEMVKEVKGMKTDLADEVRTQREEIRTERTARKAAVADFKKGATNARTSLTSRRKGEADEMRTKATTNRERRSAGLEEQAQSKRRARDLVLDDRRPPSSASASPTTPKSTRKLKRGVNS